MINILISYGSDINKSGENGKAPLFYAIEKGDKDIVNTLLSLGADINKTDSANKTQLFYAIEKENKDMISILISQGSDINKTEYSGRTPLFYAVGIDSNVDNNADQSGAVVFANISPRINGIEVKVVGQFAFRSSTSLKSIFIPYTVTEMRYDALAHNQNLNHVEFAENSRLKTLGRGIFYNTALRNIRVPNSVKELGILCLDCFRCSFSVFSLLFSSVSLFIGLFTKHVTFT